MDSLKVDTLVNAPYAKSKLLNIVCVIGEEETGKSALIDSLRLSFFNQEFSLFLII